MSEERKLSESDYVASGGPAGQREPPPARSGGGGTAAASERPAALFPDHEASEMRSRWDDIQTSFVDQPRKAVEEADHLVSSAIQRLARSFGDERARLEGQWAKGDVNTEDLRIALQRYRSFFTRLLAI